MNNFIQNTFNEYTKFNITNRFIVYPHWYEVTSGKPWNIRNVMILSYLPQEFIPGIDNVPVGTSEAELAKAFDEFCKSKQVKNNF